MEQKLLNGIDKLDDDAVVDALRWGASISALKKSTICRLANSFGTAKLLERLLAHKADVRHHDRGFSPLHHACAAPDNIAVLLRHRADVSCKDPEKGETPLMVGVVALFVWRFSSVSHRFAPDTTTQPVYSCCSTRALASTLATIEA